MRNYWKSLAALIAVCMPLGSLGATPTTLANGGFERTDAKGPSLVAAWSAYGQGYAIDTQVRHTGLQSLRCQNPESGLTSGAFITCALHQSRALPILVTGWSKAQNVDGVTDNDYAVYVDLTYTDGSSLWGQTAPFETGSHDWQHRRLRIFPSKPVRSMNVYALFRSHAGTVWFDDFDARQVTSDTLFDGQDVAPPVIAKGASSGWFVRDVATGSPFQPLIPGRTTLGLRLNALHSTCGGRVEQATLKNQTPRDRAVTVYYVERFSAPHPIWWNNIRDSVSATESREYAVLTQAGAGATGQLSLYPFGCVTGRGSGRVIGVPPGLGPRVTRTVFRPDTHLLFLADDVALTGRGDPAGHDNAVVAAAHYNADPAWGFRDAAAQWYALFPDAYQRRAKAEGIWMPFTDPSKVSEPADFHFAYHEGDNSVVSDRRQGILSFRYVEPMTYWMPMAKETPRTYAAAFAQAQTLAASGPEEAKRQSQAVMSSGSQDVQGRMNVAFRDAPWCDGAVWVLNPSPQIGSATDLWTKARLNSAAEPTPGAANQPDGEYLDSLEAWADVLDYRPVSLRDSSVAPCFTPDNFRPTLPTWFSVYTSAASLSHDLHRRGALLMANSVPWRFSAFAPLLDVMGTETNMFTGTGAWAPEPDAVMDLRRTTAYHKPYLLLLNTDFSKVDSKKIALYFQRCMFYGIYPSMFSANAANHPYWENADLYNRDRPLFRKYIPVIQKLSAAGWEPITWARSNSPDVWLERYGRKYLTVMNPKDAPANVTIRIDTTCFFPATKGIQKVVISDAISGATLLTATTNGKVPVGLTLNGSQTRVLSLRLIETKMSMKGPKLMKGNN